jgi:hypothetical protein
VVRSFSTRCHCQSVLRLVPFVQHLCNTRRERTERFCTWQEILLLRILYISFLWPNTWTVVTYENANIQTLYITMPQRTLNSDRADAVSHNISVVDELVQSPVVGSTSYWWLRIINKNGCWSIYCLIMPTRLTIYVTYLSKTTVRLQIQS